MVVRIPARPKPPQPPQPHTTKPRSKATPLRPPFGAKRRPLALAATTHTEADHAFSPGIISRTPPDGSVTVSPLVGPTVAPRMGKPGPGTGYGSLQLRPSSVEFTSIGVDPPAAHPPTRPCNGWHTVHSDVSLTADRCKARADVLSQ